MFASSDVARAPARPVLQQTGGSKHMGLWSMYYEAKAALPAKEGDPRGLQAF